MTNLEANLLEVLTCETVRFCSRAVRFFSAPLVQMCTALIRDFHHGFGLKALTGPYGSYDNCCYFQTTNVCGPKLGKIQVYLRSSLF